MSTIYRKFKATSSDGKNSIDCYRFEQARKFGLPWCLDQSSGKVERRTDESGAPVTVTIEESFVDELGNEVDSNGKPIVGGENPEAHNFTVQAKGFLPVKPGTPLRAAQLFTVESVKGAWELKPTSATAIAADVDTAASALEERAAKLRAKAADQIKAKVADEKVKEKAK